MVINGNKSQKKRSTKILLDSGSKDLHGQDSKDHGAKKMTRRTITIDEQNERNLNQLRGRLLTDENTELDYTAAVNMVIALGFNRIAEGDLKETEKGIANKYIFGTELKIDALNDEHWNYWIDNVYPEMEKQYQELLQEKESHGSSDKEKQRVGTPQA